jgi:hypothetical protein
MTLDRRQVPFTPEQADYLQHCISEYPTKHSFAFYNLEELHTFQFAITGFQVKFDGLARDFCVSRRRGGATLSLHKRLDAGLTRVQIVSHNHDGVVQLLAFFDDQCTWADSMGFVVKGVDIVERYEAKGGRLGVRLVDAKFSLPRMEKSRGGAKLDDVERGFICLDMPEYPGENDDIWIGFDDNEGTSFTGGCDYVRD